MESVIPLMIDVAEQCHKVQVHFNYDENSLNKVLKKLIISNFPAVKSKLDQLDKTFYFQKQRFLYLNSQPTDQQL